MNPKETPVPEAPKAETAKSPAEGPVQFTPPLLLSLLSALKNEPSSILLAIAAIVYATGFLIVFTFYDSYWIRGVDVEFFKIKYLHVGLMFEAFLLSVAFPIFATLQYHYHRKKGQKWLLTRRGILAFTLLALTYFLFSLFAPPGTFREWDVQVALLVSIVVPLGARIYLIKKRPEKVRRRIALMLIVLLALCLAAILRHFYRDFWAMMFPVGLWFVFFSALCAGLLWISLIPNEQVKTTEERHFRATLALVVLALLYFLAIMAFGFGVYHFIPAANGGGDFKYGGRIVLYLSPDSSAGIPHELIASKTSDLVVTKELILIEGTRDSIYVADPEDNGGPEHWRQGRHKRPHVHEMRREILLNIEYQNASTALPSKQTPPAPKTPSP